MLCLRWDDFGSHFSTSFKDLRARNDTLSYFDVSLAVQDQDEVIKAHKVILSSCSPFFKRVLAQQAKISPLGGLVHPVIYLRGVSSRQLSNLLDFMYHGEINVAQDDLDDFLAIAEDLKVQGLTNHGYGHGDFVDDKTSFESTKRPNLNRTSQPSTRLRQRKVHTEDVEEDDEVEVIKEEQHAIANHVRGVGTSAVGEQDLEMYEDKAADFDDNEYFYYDDETSQNMGYEDSGHTEETSHETEPGLRKRRTGEEM